MPEQKKSKEKEAYVVATELSKELHNLKIRNPSGKNVAVLEARIEKKTSILSDEQKAAIQSWADNIPE